MGGGAGRAVLALAGGPFAQPAASSPGEGSFVPWPFSPAAAPAVCGHRRFPGGRGWVLAGPHGGDWGWMAEEGVAIRHVSGQEGSLWAEAPRAAPLPVGHTQAGTFSSFPLSWRGAMAGSTPAAGQHPRSFPSWQVSPGQVTASRLPFLLPRQNLGLAASPRWLPAPAAMATVRSGNPQLSSQKHGVQPSSWGSGAAGIEEDGILPAGKSRETS